MPDKPHGQSIKDQMKSVRTALGGLSESNRSLAEQEGLRQIDYALSALEALLLDLDEQRHKQEALKVELLSLDRRLRRVEESVVFRLLRRVGYRLHSLSRRAGRILLHTPLHPLYLRMRGGLPFAEDYREWLEAHRSAFDMLPADTTGFPSFSILLPVHEPRLEWLRHAVESVIAQTYPDWQLCIAVDGALSLEADAALNQFVQSDPRIIRVGGRNLGLSGALNLALGRAGLDYVAVLDQDDLLEPAALEQVAMSLKQDPADLLYSDEDYTNHAGLPEQPNFKPAFSPEMLLSCMYLGHLLVVSRERLQALGGFRSRFDGAQDYDMVLRLLAAGGRIRHLPRVLYHWRRHSGSTAASAASKPYTHDAGHRALQEYLNQCGQIATVEDSHAPNIHQIRWNTSPDGLGSLVIPSRTAALLEDCLEGLRSSAAGAEIVLVHHLSDPDENRRIEMLGQTYKCRRVAYSGPFNYARMCNLGFRAATGDYLVFLNDDVRPVSTSWLERIAGHLGRPHVGVVGGLLRYPDGSIQHAGIALGMVNAAGHVGRSLFDSHLFPWINYSRDVSAVTGACLGIRRELFERLGGFDEIFPGNFNDVDLCLRVRKDGKSVILDRTVELTHFENTTRKDGHNSEERLLFLRRWNSVVQKGDPFYSPHLSLDLEQPSLPL
jgi:O-antigen biosynthesis protein